MAKLLLLQTVFFMAVVAARAPSWPWSSHRHGSSKPKSKHKRRKLASMLTVDPTKILATLIKHGGLLIPDAIESDLDILRSVFHVEKAELNVIEKQLVVYNFTIGLKGEPEDLRVGRVYVHWDSYHRPCLDIEVDDVAILVEFSNLMLTRNNWNELKKHGFPPEMKAPEPKDTLKKPDKQAKSPFVRFGSIDLSGNITVHVKSRPLRRDMGIFTLDMDETDDVNLEIVKLSDSNLVTAGRRGCTPNELADLFKSYFTGKIKSHIAKLKADPRAALHEADRIAVRASESVLEYAGEAGIKGLEDVEQRIAGRLDSAESRINAMTEAIKLRVNATALKKRLQQHQKAMEPETVVVNKEPETVATNKDDRS